MTKKLLLFLVSIWWGWTALIDFVVVPTLFSVINDFFNAGELGIAVFSKLNVLEVIVSSLLILIIFFNFKREGRGKIQLLLAFGAWFIVLFYFLYLTPKLILLTNLWKEAELINKIGIAGINDIQQEHQSYHRMYVGLDSLKFLILSFILGLNLFKSEAKLEKS